MEDPVEFISKPEFRKGGEWPGREFLQNMVRYLYVMILLTILSSRFLVSNTMHTIVSEQKKEIAQMKAIGATNFQVFKSYLITAVLMGGIGSVIGAVLGIFLSHFVLIYIGTPWGFVPGFGVHLPTVLLSIAVGIGVVIGSALPALIISSRQTVREGLESPGITTMFEKGYLERLLLRTTKLPRTVQMGLRNAVRKKGRSAVTVLQVAMSVGVFLGLFAFGHSLINTLERHYDYMEWDIVNWQHGEGDALPENFSVRIEAIDGVSYAEPAFITEFQIKDFKVHVFGMIHNTTTYNYKKAMFAGRWFNQEEEETRANVIVMGQGLAENAELEVGKTITVIHTRGTADFKVIGIVSSFEESGMVAYIPLSTIQNIFDLNDKVIGFFIQTESKNHNDIDRIATKIEDVTKENGYTTNSNILYVREDTDLKQNENTMNLFYWLILLVVFISMIGLLSTLTMNIMDRTKEIGMMRCLGSRSKDIWSMFCSEGIFLSLSGFVIGIPIGYFLGTLIVDMVAGIMGLHIVFAFPLQYIFWGFLVTLFGTMVIIQLPLWRATKILPGDALRYQ
jgi:putative ABC transport system permease protein